ncbi:MAG: helix-turn-helix transcriptional regulator [Anaerovorax sp.]|nr:helix-turn-helix transcriptional regulator [Anaerovorax sp.]
MKKDLNMQIGLRIRNKREELKLSREKLAECIDVSPQFLAQIELGRRGMSTTTLYKVCNALSASADYIVLGKQEKNNLTVFHELLSNLNPKYLPYVEDLLKTFILAVNK